MADGSSIFDATGTRLNAYELFVSATTTAVAGGTQVDISAYVEMFRNPGQPAWGSSGTKSWSMPGARSNSTSGPADAGSGPNKNGGNASWSYDFRSQGTPATSSVYGGFTRFVPYSQGSSTTLRVSAAGSGSDFLTSATVNLTIPLFAEPVPPVPAPGSPSNVVVDVIERTSLRLNWDGSSGTVSRYRVYKDDVAQDTTTDTVYTFTGLSANTSYKLGVRAEGPDANSSIVSVNETTLPNTFTVPNVVGQATATAVTNLTNAGFSSVTQNLTTVGATQLNNRTVKSQSPAANTTATAGDDAAIESYNFVRTVPNIVGRTKAQGEADLSAAGFSNFSSSLRTSGATLANNKIIATQSPASGTLLNIADQVTFTINDYRIPVPDIRGLSRQNAINTLNAAGFTNVTVTSRETGATAANNLTVFSQNPVNSGTTFNPADQGVSFVIYDLGIVGKRMTATNNSVPLTRSSRLTDTGWVQTVVAKKFTASGWVDITLK